MIKTIEQVRIAFRANGVSVAAWSRNHGFTLPLVYAVLHGRSRALRGESYKIAVALGLRPPPDIENFDDSMKTVDGTTLNGTRCKME